MRAAIVLGVVVASSATARADAGRTARAVTTGICELRGLDERTAELLGRPAIVGDAKAQVGVYTAEEEGGGISATLTFADEAGVSRSARTFTGANCEEVLDSLAVMISILLRLDAEELPPPASAPPARAAPPAPLASAPASAPVEVDTPPPPARPRSSTKMLEVGTMATTGEQALVVGGRLERRRHALGVELHVHMPTTTVLGVGEVSVWTATFDALGCFRRGGFGACAFGMVGVVRGQGEDLMDPRSSIRPIAGVGARVEWRQSFARWGGLRVFADAQQLLATTRFLVDDMAVWTSDARQVWVGAGIYFHSP